MRRFLAVAIALAALTGGALVSAAPAHSGTTDIPFHARIGTILGLVPPVSEESNGAVSNSAPASGKLVYNGGPVMPTSKVYTIFWQPSGYQFPANYTANMNQFFKDLQATAGKNTNTYVNATQYYEETNGQRTYVQNRTTFAGTDLDTNALPSLDPVNCPDTPVAAAGGANGDHSTTAGCVTDAQMQAEISNVIKAKKWPVSNTTEFFIFTAPNIGTCFPAEEGVDQSGITTSVTAPLCSFSYFCAYHSAYSDSTINANSQIIYSNMPYAAQTAGNPVTCDEQSYPNGNPSDAEMSVTSHEHNESITDPFGTGWWDSDPNDSAYGMENGDMCAWDFGNLSGPDGAQYNQTINGHNYLLQLEWDNTTLGCPGSDSSGNAVPSQPNYDTPQISLSPASGFATAPFKISGLFYSAGDSIGSTFTDSGLTNSLGTATANASGQFSLTAKVPSKAKAGTGTVTSRGKSGTATAQFSVLH
ncbi:MAG TPA: hypothetical protein VGU02_09920 [Gaiellaceae bacterium]|nr:hypothetical protein [Gaiellaceae bacterium]